MKALEQKTSQALQMEEEFRRLKASLSDQEKIKREKQLLRIGQVELQRERQEVCTERAKLQVRTIAYPHACKFMSICEFAWKTF